MSSASDVAAGGGRPVGPYSPVTRAGTWVVTSGQVGAVTGPDGTPRLVPGGIEAELRQVLTNLAGVLRLEGAGLADVKKAMVFLIDMEDYGVMNRIWIEAFADPKPARSAVAVAALPLGARVEVEAWAFLPPTPHSPAPSSGTPSGASPGTSSGASGDALTDHAG